MKELQRAVSRLRAARGREDSGEEIPALQEGVLKAFAELLEEERQEVLLSWLEGRRSEKEMAKWKYRLDLAELFKAYSTDKVSLQKAGKKISEKILGLSCLSDPEYVSREALEVLAGEFRLVETEDLFNRLMDALYDWGDTKLGKGCRTCWIETE